SVDTGGRSSCRFFHRGSVCRPRKRFAVGRLLSLHTGAFRSHFGRQWKQRADLHDASWLKQEVDGSTMLYVRGAIGSDYGYGCLLRLFSRQQSSLACVSCTDVLRGRQGNSGISAILAVTVGLRI